MENESVNKGERRMVMVKRYVSGQIPNRTLPWISMEGYDKVLYHFKLYISVAKNEYGWHRVPNLNEIIILESTGQGNWILCEE